MKKETGYFVKQVGISKLQAQNYNQDGFIFYGFEDTARGYCAMFSKKTEQGYQDLRILVKNLVEGDLPRYIKLGLTQA